ncbi:MAG TPA: NHLP bacteriocin system secretion protein [Azospirillaceae bacterium]|nr:NHLP bacteriocin system secretion protein [Azospirillaceae bacterium]HRQ81516.1 NHLP bacteriocin system secretion protein [Azospirillaceae bacterium]
MADDSNNSLFRAAAQAGAADNLDLGVEVVRAPQWMLLATALVLAIGAVWLSFTLSVPSKVVASGILITAEGLKDVETLAGGRVKDIFVFPGDHVRRGQKIVQIEQPDLAQELEQAQAELAHLNGRYRRVAGFHRIADADTGAMLARRRSELENLLAANAQQIEWLQKNLAGYESLASRGVISQQKFFEAKVALNEAIAEQMRNANALTALQFDANTRKIEQEREILDLEIKIEQVRSKIAGIREKRQRMAFLESPYDGVVIEQKVDLGELIEVGKPVLSILPGYSTDEDSDGAADRMPLVATLYLPSADGKRVRPGMAAQISPTAIRREEYGYIHATIDWRSAVPATPEGMMRSLKNRQMVESLSLGGAPFEAKATLHLDPATPSGFRWSSSRGPNQTIGAGSLISAQVIVKEQPLASLVMPALRGLLGDMAQ